MTALKIETVGRRHYITGNTYPVKDALRAAGAKWDSDRKCWWTGNKETAESVLSLAPAVAPTQSYSPAEGESLVAVSGNTYPVREQLLSLGGQWDAASKSWRVPSSQAAAARALVAAAPRSDSRAAGRRVRSGVCRECRGPLRDCPRHRAMGGLCGECAFDEYDM